MVRLESDPDVMKFTPSRIPLSVEKIEARLNSLLEKEALYSPLGVWAVELKDTAEFVGWFMLIQTEFEVPEIGFMKDQWGKGLATEVAQTLVDFGIKKLNYPGIAAVTDLDNATSIHTLKKLGFQKKGSRTKLDKVLGKEIETLIFELRK